MKLLWACVLAAAAVSAQTSTETAGDGSSSPGIHSSILTKAFELKGKKVKDHHAAFHNRMQNILKAKRNGDEPGETGGDPKSGQPAATKKTRIKKQNKGEAEKAERKDRFLKSKRSSSSRNSGTSSSQDEELCEVTVTNLSAFQVLEDFFVMIHSAALVVPVFQLGAGAVRFRSVPRVNNTDEIMRIDNGLAELAQDSDTDDMEDFYEDLPEVFDADDINGPLRAGAAVTFIIEYVPGVFDRLSVVVSVLFSNDAFTGIAGAAIADDVTAFTPTYDAGVENNLATCWSVKADQNDFPVASACADNNDSDDNENDQNQLGPPEGFVGIHRGITNSDEDFLDDFLDQFDCDENEADDFSEYFGILGYDDIITSIDDDQLFIAFARANNFVDDMLDRAGDSDDFDDFCDRVEDLLEEIEDDFGDLDDRLESELFDWQNPILQIELECEDSSSSSDD